MKKLTLGLIAAMAVSLTSCDMSSEQKVSNTLTVCNLVTDLTTNETTASECSYKYEVEFSKGTANISGDPVTLGSRNYSFDVTGATIYDGNFFTSGLVVGTIKNVSGNLNGAYESLPIQDAEFMLLPGMLGQQCLCASYRAGNEYIVRTFPAVALYTGTTHTSYPGQNGMASFESKNMSYGVRIDLKTKKADVIIYNAKFSDNPKEPEKSEVLIEGLDFELAAGAYRLVGQNITPKIPEGGKYTEYNNFNISQIMLQPMDAKMIGAAISYTVLHTMTINMEGTDREMTVTYKGDFSGSYAFLPEVKP